MSANTAGLHGFEDVADSTDWLATPLSGLAAVEAALRCQVCKDFYRTPMLTSCNHTFCSLCIRRALANDGKCPLCRASEQEVKLRSNWSMEEVVAAFTQTRPDVLRLAQNPPSPPPQPQPHASDHTPKRHADEVEHDDARPGSERSSKRLRSSARLSKSRSMEATAEMARQEADVPAAEETPDFEDFEPDDGLVACPICWKRMRPLQVDRHLDTSCPGSPAPQQQQQQQKPPAPFPGSSSSSSSSRRPTRPTTISSSTPFTQPHRPPPRLERLPAINYSMLKEAQLRRKAGEQGLSTNGGRAALERRHREWTTLWNANCDALRPRRKADLLHELEVWERSTTTQPQQQQGGLRAPPLSSTSTSTSACAGSANGVGAAAASPSSTASRFRDKDFDGAAWAARHDGSFRDLIASARKNMGPRTAAGAEARSTTSTTGADGEAEAEPGRGRAADGSRLEEERHRPRPKPEEKSRPEMSAVAAAATMVRQTTELTSQPAPAAEPELIDLTGEVGPAPPLKQPSADANAAVVDGHAYPYLFQRS
ncbi:DNA repair protein rad18 [Xylariaceae sp. FL0804]|nr:DNA repair protein rad18 [Xylariaceae sp. FL0804]